MEVKKTETKTAKMVRILKTVFKGLKIVFKWSSDNLTMGKVIKWGFILLIVGTIAKAAIFG
ncbi:hypothetical protein ES702_02132 [subsurface metagenome]